LQAKSAPSACVIFTTDFATQNLRQVRVLFLPHALGASSDWYFCFQKQIKV
jgi:hypothetical protein